MSKLGQTAMSRVASRKARAMAKDAKRYTSLARWADDNSDAYRALAMRDALAALSTVAKLEARKA